MSTLYENLKRMSTDELEAFRAQLRRRYSRDDILGELRSCAARLGTSPTMREFAADPQVGIHPQTVVEHFGTWNDAKRAAGLMPRRMASSEELIAALRKLGERLGRVPTAKDVDLARGSVPSKSVYVNAFGSLQAALTAAGFDAPSKEEKLRRSIDFAAAIYLRSHRLPSFREWERLRGNRTDVMSAWQIYRAFECEGGAWSAFLFTATRRADEAREQASGQRSVA